MKLSENEVLVKEFNLYSNTVGTKKTERDIMISFVKDKDQFAFVDVFITKEQAMHLKERLGEMLTDYIG